MESRRNSRGRGRGGSRLPLAARLVLPFVLLHLIVSVVAGTAAILSVRRAANLTLAEHAERGVGVLAASRFALREPFLQHVKAMTGADVLAYRPGGEIVAGTLSAEASAEFVARVRSSEVGATGGMIRIGGRSFRLAEEQFSPDGKQSAVRVALLYPAERQQRIVRSAIYTVVVAAIAGVAAVVGIGWRMARSITAPMRTLSRSVRSVDLGDGLLEVEIGEGDEVAELADSFNQMVRALREAREELARTERLAAAGRIAASLAHEIRNPLSSIRVLAELVRERVAVEEVDQEALTTVVEEVQRVEHVVQNLLDLARPASLHCERIDAHRLLDDLVHLLEPRLRHRGVMLSVVAGEDDGRIEGDPDKLKQALMNLVLNAEEAMPQGGDLTLRFELARNGKAVFSVEDRGMGMDGQIAARVREPFITSKPDGVGLGLFVTSRIAADHGGRLTLAAREGGGTIATLTLPVGAGLGGG